MCGILLYIGNESLEASHPALSVISHRGPDAAGMVNFPLGEKNLSIGHRRLSIIDLTDQANQPMQDPASALWITFNGEIYNYIELRKELESLGRVFRTHSDTEVLLIAYAQWGEACLSKLNGMFSFCIWDSKKKVIFIARDRYGIKPLYFWNSTKGFSVASEIKQFTALSGFSSKVNDVMALAFLYGNDFSTNDETIWEGVLELEPGNCIRLDLNKWSIGDPIRQISWYEPDAFPMKGPDTLNAVEHASEFKAILDDAIRIRMRSDVNVTSLLSSGIDSSAIAYLSSSYASHSNPMHTFTASYLGGRHDEWGNVSKLDNKFLKLNRIVIHPDDLVAAIENVSYSYDIPNQGRSTIPHYLLYKSISSKNFKVTLEGQGADEILGGYSSFSIAYMCDLLRKLKLFSLINVIYRHADEYKSNAYLKIARELAQYQNSSSSRMRAFNRAFDPSQEAIINLGSIPKGLIFSALVPRTSSRVSDMHQIRMKVLRQILHNVDRASMSHSVETRVPFLDYRLVDYALPLPAKLKIKSGFRKHLLRMAMNDVLPREVCWRKGKLGFSSPEASWVRSELKDYMLYRFEKLKHHPLVNYDVLLKKYRLFLEEKIPYDAIFWRLASFSQWLETFSIKE